MKKMSFKNIVLKIYDIFNEDATYSFNISWYSLDFIQEDMMILHLQAHLSRRDISAAQTVNQYGSYSYGDNTLTNASCKFAQKFPFTLVIFMGDRKIPNNTHS